MSNGRAHAANVCRLGLTFRCSLTELYLASSSCGTSKTSSGHHSKLYPQILQTHLLRSYCIHAMGQDMSIRTGHLPNHWFYMYLRLIYISLLIVWRYASSVYHHDVPKIIVPLPLPNEDQPLLQNRPPDLKPRC